MGTKYIIHDSQFTQSPHVEFPLCKQPYLKTERIKGSRDIIKPLQGSTFSTSQVFHISQAADPIPMHSNQGRITRLLRVMVVELHKRNVPRFPSLSDLLSTQLIAVNLPKRSSKNVRRQQWASNWETSLAIRTAWDWELSRRVLNPCGFLDPFSYRPTAFQHKIGFIYPISTAVCHWKTSLLVACFTHSQNLSVNNSLLLLRKV
jgi:hypothetical protein